MVISVVLQKDQSHPRSKIDLEMCWRHHSRSHWADL